MPDSAAILLCNQHELSIHSNKSCQRPFWIPTRLKASAAASISEGTSASKTPGSTSDSSASKRHRQSELVHPLFSKEKQKEKATGGSKASRPSASSQPAKRSSKPVAKSEQRPLKASQTSATGPTSAELEIKQRSRSQTKKVAQPNAEVSSSSVSQQAASAQQEKGAKEKGPKNQVAFAPQPTKLRMAPISPDAIADPYQ